MQITAIYPGTFDPITRGHSDIVIRASQLFSRVIIAVADSNNKSTLFSTEERKKLVMDAMNNAENIEVVSFHGLVTEFAIKNEAKVIIRGLRAVSDFEYEFQMAGMNRKLADGIETLFLMPAEDLNYLSSSLVREIASLGGNVAQFVHPLVNKALKAKFDT